MADGIERYHKTRAFHVPTGNTTGATGNTCGDSRYRLGARGSNSPGRLGLGHQGGASRRGEGDDSRLLRVARAGADSADGTRRCEMRRATKAVPRAPPLPPRSLPIGHTPPVRLSSSTYDRTSRRTSPLSHTVRCLLSNPNRMITKPWPHPTSSKAADRLWAEASHAKACSPLATSDDAGSSSGSSGRR
eukprot:scaffold19649_cov44-Phaeocystis_antarctica.AAC.1